MGRGGGKSGGRVSEQHSCDTQCVCMCVCGGRGGVRRRAAERVHQVDGCVRFVDTCMSVFRVVCVQAFRALQYH